VLSRAETLGRISRAGFRIKQESFIGNLLCIEARKIDEPLPINENVYGPLIALSRIGRDGNMIKVYKLRKPPIIPIRSTYRIMFMKCMIFRMAES